MSAADGIDITCPGCNQRLRVPTTTAGMQIACPDCSATIDVPQLGIQEPQWSTPKSESSSQDQDDNRRHEDDDDDRRHDDSAYPIGVSSRGARSRSGLTSPAICMIVVACLGFLFNTFGALDAVFGQPFPVNPQDPRIVQQIAEFSHGPLTASIRAFFGVLSAITIVGSIQMIRRRTWGLALTAAILSMINFGGLCCVLGLPFGIWSAVVLMRPEAADEFARPVSQPAPKSRDRW